MKTFLLKPLAAVALALIALPAFAGTYESDWSDAGSRFDDSTGNGGLPVSAPSQSSYRGQEKISEIVRHAQDDRVSATIDAPVFRVWTQLEAVPQTYTDLDCSRVSGEGRGDWHGFFSASRYEKPARLAEAVEGIGDATAPCIVESGVFSSKPRTWNSFKERIRQAEEACGKGIYSRVIVQYGRQNAENLGYYSAEACVEVQKTELVVQAVEHKEFSHSVQATVTAQIRNAPLLPSEAETVRLRFDGFQAGVQVDSRYNQFNVQKVGKSDFVLTGQRQQVTPNNSLDAGLLTQNGVTKLRITDMDYRPNQDPAARSFAVVSVKVSRRFWFDKKVAEVRLPLTGGSVMLPVESLVSAVVDRGASFDLEYTVVRQNSQFNNNSESAAKTLKGLTR